MNCYNLDDRTQEQLQVNLHYPDQGDSEYAADPGYGKCMSCTLRYMSAEDEIFVEYYCKIPRRFCRVSFDTERLNKKYREEFTLLSFVPDKEDFSFIWLQFQCIRRHR